MNIPNEDFLNYLVDENFKQKNIKALFTALNILQLFSFFGLAGYMIGKSLISYSIQLIASLFISLLFSFTFLIIIHELFHVLAMLVIGIRSIGFNFLPKQLIFYVYSKDERIFNGYEIIFTAIFPFIMLSFMLLMAFYFYTDFRIEILLVLSVHFNFCNGDFHLIYYILKENPKKVQFKSSCNGTITSLLKNNE